MALFTLVASITKKRAIVSTLITDEILVPEFRHNDNLTGQITVVSETADPTAPTAAVAVDSVTAVALTDGLGLVYATATGLSVSGGNVLNFTLVVDSAAMIAALAASLVDYINAFLEVKFVVGTQILRLLREPVTIQKSGV